MEDIKSFEGKLVTDAETKENVLWGEIANATIKNMQKSYDEPAKQIITVSGVLQGLYFVAISFSTLKNLICLNCIWDYLFNILIFLTPVGSWILSLYFAISVLIPKIRTPIGYKSTSEVQIRWQSDRDSKTKNLMWAKRALVFGLLWLIFSIGYYLFFFHAPDTNYLYNNNINNSS